MSRERCVGFMADLERRDLDVLSRWFTEDTELWVPPATPVRGRRRILAMFRAIYRMYADIHWRVTDVFEVEGGRWVYLTDSWGTIGQSTPYRNHLITLVEFDDEGRIVRLSDYFKDTAIFLAGRERPPRPAGDPSRSV